MKTSIFITALSCFLCLASVQAQTVWPQKILSEEGLKITIYQPQSETIKDNVLMGRAALSVVNMTGSDPVFGVCWFKANLKKEDKNKIADLSSIEITRLRDRKSTRLNSSH